MEETKHWWQSKTVWGSIVSVGALGAGALGYTIGEQIQISLVEAILGLVGIGGNLIAIYGRLTASKTIR